MLRVREGDTVEIDLSNAADAGMTHSIDLHAVTGPGGGAKVMQIPPGEDGSFKFAALTPACTSTTALPRWWPNTSPALCTA
jgi:nitrite reductase (NO-forming)